MLSFSQRTKDRESASIDVRNPNVGVGRQSVAVLCAVLGSTIFLSAFISRREYCDQLLPWSVTITLVTIFSLIALLRKRPAEILIVPGSMEPVRLSESWSASYLAAAAIVLAIALMPLLMPKSQMQKAVRYVDIELSCLSDARDNKSVMPATKPFEDLRKRSANQVQQQGKTHQKAQPTRAVKTETSSPPIKPQPKMLALKQERNADPLKMPIFIQQPIAKPVQPPQQVKPQTKQMPQNVPFMEEVGPPELVELVENEGDRGGMHVFQDGGSSTGGKGARNELSNFLEELHKDIKSAWSPPRGMSRRAEIVFRIKKGGKLAFLKLVRTSGDPETDEAAMKAITKAVQQSSLPASYPFEVLDVQYSFNYTADELTEVPNRK